MNDENFTALVWKKIEERREGRSAAVLASAKTDERFHALAMTRTKDVGQPPQ